MNSAPPDQTQRDIIERELDETILVEAAAGTGKTTSMMKRMVALLAKGTCRIHQLAAVTFTRKAAAELRSRFQLALETAVRTASDAEKANLENALSHMERCFIGTIHSFCARLLRERPVEAQVDVAFEEIDENADMRLRKAAWDEYAARLHAENDPVLQSLASLGLEIGRLWESFCTFADYPDVSEWPAAAQAPPSWDGIRAMLRSAADYVRGTSKDFPTNYSDWAALMRKYDRVERMVRNGDLERSDHLIAMLKQFTGVQTEFDKWPQGERRGREEHKVWKEYKDQADGYLDQWRRYAYPMCIRTFRDAQLIYDRLRREAGQLNYQDLLIKARDLLADKPLIREYFRSRFTHLLVDEFQDTDPVQAEVMMFLTATEPGETDWQQCRPRRGSLFVVGDPKQSIYRFRRADIVTYNKVKEIIAAHGLVVRLQANFRSSPALIDWVNSTFRGKFPSHETPQAPVYVPLLPGNPSSSCGTAAVDRIRVPDHTPKERICEQEAQVIASSIRKALDDKPAVSATGEDAQPGDFMIITRKRKNLGLYSRVLQEWGIPHAVTGGNALNRSSELSMLRTCLAAVLEPDNPVALVAALRSELFGISDTALYHFERAGGVFAYGTSLPPGYAGPEAEAVADAFDRLRRYSRWFRVLPPAAAVERVAADLGLVVTSALEPDGNTRSGSFLKAVELLRSAQNDTWTAYDLVSYLDSVLNGEEQHDGIPALPEESSGVQVMNLHKAKGLEARTVFLADPTGRVSRPPTMHVDRTAPEVKGYMVIQGPGFASYARPVLALPADWETFKVREKEFEEAEETRLLYVAATRAGSRLTVTQREPTKKGGNQYNPWKTFHKELSGRPERNGSGARPHSAGEREKVELDESVQAEERIRLRWETAMAPTYQTAGVKAISLARLTAPPTAGGHGTEWGTVIHSLLQAAMVNPAADLTNLAEAAADEQRLEPDLAEAAVATVQSVMASEIWQRAARSPRRLVEVPFQRLSEPRSEDGGPLPEMILRGVIDLVFLEPDGWVIVDYKTDRRLADQLSDLVERYREQVRLYGEAWENLTGEKVAESGLFFTHSGTYVVC